MAKVKKESTALAAVKEPKEVMVHAAAEAAQDWGTEATLTAKDFVIPKILPMQPGSKLVTDGLATFGQFRDSLSGNLLGDMDTPLEFIPFYLEKVWVVMQKEGKSFRYKRQVPITAENEGQEFEQVSEDDIPEKWYRTFMFYVILPSDIAKGSEIPYVLSFRSTSAHAGKKLITTMYMKNLKAGKTPASMCMELSGIKRQNDDGTFLVLDVKEKRPSEKAEIEKAYSWLKMVQKGKARVDHSDLETKREEQQAPDSTDY
jgi:hypothetical protein